VNREAPLGVFDSGLGGLTVVRALRAALPHEDIVYLGDTARVPYGTKGPATVLRYALNCTRALVDRGVKAIVIACNTVSAVAPDRLRADFDKPVLSVIEPGARAAIRSAGDGRIGVLGTTATIASGAYVRAVSANSTRCEVLGRAAPLLVPLAEEGWLEGEVPSLVVREYLSAFVGKGIGAVVLGCTHYPLFRPLIEEQVRALLGPHVNVVDSALATADETRAFLVDRELTSTRTRPGELEFLVTDRPRSFEAVAQRFLGDAAPAATVIDL
jgi:glutamate racemase